MFCLFFPRMNCQTKKTFCSLICEMFCWCNRKAASLCFAFSGYPRGECGRRNPSCGIFVRKAGGFSKKNNTFLLPALQLFVKQIGVKAHIEQKTRHIFLSLYRMCLVLKFKMLLLGCCRTEWCGKLEETVRGLRDGGQPEDRCTMGVTTQNERMPSWDSD